MCEVGEGSDLLEPIELVLGQIVLLRMVKQLVDQLVLEDILKLGVLRALCLRHDAGVGK